MVGDVHPDHGVETGRHTSNLTNGFSHTKREMNGLTNGEHVEDTMPVCLPRLVCLSAFDELGGAEDCQRASRVSARFRAVATSR